MRILFVDQTGQLGGGELSLLDIVLQTRYDAEVVLFSDGPFRARLEEHGITVHLLDVGDVLRIKRRLNPQLLVRVLWQYHSVRRRFRHLATGFDLVYANSQKAFIVAACCLPRSTPLIWHLRDLLSESHFSYLFRKVPTWLSRVSASLVIANSEATRASLIAQGGRASRVLVVYNGIDAKPFDVISQEQVRALRLTLSLDDATAIGSFGRLAPWKGQHVLIEALSSLPGTKAIIVGEALFGEDTYAELLHQLAVQRGVADRVQFLGFRGDIQLLMKAVDIVVHTSTAPEPFGRVLVEGMLARRPVIATYHGGTGEIITSKRDGLLIAPGSPEELARAIRLLVSDSEYRERLASAGHKRAVLDFTVTAMIGQIDILIAQQVKVAQERSQTR